MCIVPTAVQWEHYQECITESSESQKYLFKYLDEFLEKRKSTAVPKLESVEELCNKMATIVSEKMCIIREGLAERQLWFSADSS